MAIAQGLRSGVRERVLTKKDIVRTISEEIGLTQQQTKIIVQKTFDAIVDSLVRERRIELRNFGVFEVKQRAARTARNPRTGRQVSVPEKYVVTFKPGKEMEAKVRGLTDGKKKPSPRLPSLEDIIASRKLEKSLGTSTRRISPSRDDAAE